jgi:DNA-binding Lrp family transcriptional regulator
MAGRPSFSSEQRARARSSARTLALSDLDRRILDLLSFLRVLTQTQLARLVSPETPPRTVRYRTARLAKHGLIGRTRPYRERGSAPHHLWPTRKGEAITEGGPPPRGGERREPNPLFLAHAAAISELYVVLRTGLTGDVRLAGFEREAEAREPFRGYDGKGHSIAPDAFFQLADPDDRRLPALIELDLGTMSNRQLKSKAEGYGNYVRVGAWRERHEFCPPLLFVTTNEKRARAFLATCEHAVDQRQMLVAASSHARDLGRAVGTRSWLVNGSEQTHDLLTILHAARRPYDESRTQEEAESRKEECERNRLRTNPEALAERLCAELSRGWGRDRLGEMTNVALLLSAEGTGDLEPVERAGFDAVAGMLDEPLLLRLADREPTETESAALDALVARHRRDQLGELDSLAAQFGEGPLLGERRAFLETGQLLRRGELERLVGEAERDRDGREAQKRLRAAYMDWREQEAKRIAKSYGVIERRRIGRDAILEKIDGGALRYCRRCEEVVYPGPDQAEDRRRRRVAERCHYCGAGFLREIDPSEVAA